MATSWNDKDGRGRNWAVEGLPLLGDWMGTSQLLVRNRIVQLFLFVCLFSFHVCDLLFFSPSLTKLSLSQPTSSFTFFGSLSSAHWGIWTVTEWCVVHSYLVGKTSVVNERWCFIKSRSRKGLTLEISWEKISNKIIIIFQMSCISATWKPGSNSFICLY